VFRTKPQIALDLIDRALANGVRVQAWTFDENYGRDPAFLDGLDQRGQLFVGEVPTNFHGWARKPRVLRSGRTGRRGRRKQYPRLAARDRRASEVRNLVRYSPVFRTKKWQRYRIKDTERGPEVWEVKWAAAWRPAGKRGRPGTWMDAGPAHVVCLPNRELDETLPLELGAKVQGPGRPRGRVIVDRQGRPAIGTRKVNCSAVGKMDVDRLGFHVRNDAPNRPQRRYTQKLVEQRGIPHNLGPPRAKVAEIHPL
jgi:hypothetical protein